MEEHCFRIAQWSYMLFDPPLQLPSQQAHPHKHNYQLIVWSCCTFQWLSPSQRPAWTPIEVIALQVPRSRNSQPKIGLKFGWSRGPAATSTENLQLHFDWAIVPAISDRQIRLYLHRIKLGVHCTARVPESGPAAFSKHISGFKALKLTEARFKWGTPLVYSKS